MLQRSAFNAYIRSIKPACIITATKTTFEALSAVGSVNNYYYDDDDVCTVGYI